MNSLFIRVRCIGLTIILAALPVTGVSAVESTPPICALRLTENAQEAAKVEAMLSTPDSFVENRYFSRYTEIHKARLRAHLFSLSPTNVYIDFGSGDGRAALGFIRERGVTESPWVYGVTVRRPPFSGVNGATWASIDREIQAAGKFKPLDGQKIEDIPDEGLPEFDVGTDIFGPLAYTLDLSGVLNKYLRRMRTAGAIYTVTLDMTFNSISSKGTTFVIDRAGNCHTVAEWLNTQTGVAAEVVRNAGDGGLIFRKTKADAQVTPLELIHIRKSAPPQRVFRELGSHAEVDGTQCVDGRSGALRPLIKILEY